MAEKHPDFSPYNYVLNNPIILIDPDGRQVRSDSPGLIFRDIYARAEQARRAQYGSGGLLHTPELKALYGGTVFGGSAVIAGMALGPQLLTAGLANAPRLNRAANRIIEAVSEAPEGTLVEDAASKVLKMGGEDIEAVVKSAQRIVKGKTPRGLQKLQRRIGSGTKEFQGLKQSPEVAENLIREILESNPIEVFDRAGRRILRDPSTGRAIRFTKEGEFDTFLGE